MSLQLLSVGAQRLVDVSLELEAGLHVVLGAPSDGCLELLQVSCGELRPSRGSVRIAGQDPRTTPQLRRAIGCAFSDPVFEEPTVARAVACRLALHNCSTSPEQAFSRFGAERFLSQNPRQLSSQQRVSVQLLLALALEQPKVLLLHEPLLSGLPLPTEELLDALRERAETATVLCTTASARTAAMLSPEVLLLQDGQLKRSVVAATRPAFTPGSRAMVRVESNASGRLVQALSQHAAVTAIRWDGSTSVVVVEGPEVERLCQAVLTTAVALGVQVHQLTQALPEASEIRATHAALARAAYERAYGAVAAVGTSSTTQGQHQ